MLIANNWWALALRGVLGILVGVLTLLWPDVALSSLIMIFAVFAIFDGIFNLAGAWTRAREHRPWGVMVLEGIVGVVAGLIAFAWPAMAAVVLVTIIAVWAIITGVLEIMAAIRLRKQITGEWLLGLAGIASLLLGVVLLAAPLFGALVIAVWFGIYALIFGVLTTVLALRLRSWRRTGIPPLRSPIASH